MQPRAATTEATREVLVFVLGDEEYGVDILKVQEIRGYEKVTAIPAAPAVLKGVVNLRGTIVPVLDLRTKFALPAPRADSQSVVIVLHLGGRMLDAVSDVIRLTPSEVRPAPQLGGVVDASYIAGVATQGGRMILLLDIEKLLSSGELNLLREAAAGPA
jgi:purine-binding chemotaxis protein CheW